MVAPNSVSVVQQRAGYLTRVTGTLFAPPMDDREPVEVSGSSRGQS